MDIIRGLLICMLLALVTTGCNDDVFVDDSTPSENSVSIDGDGGEAEVRYQPKGLMYMSFDVYGGNNPYVYLGKDGKKLTGEFKPSEIKRIELTNVYEDFYAEVNGDMITFHSVENSSGMDLNHQLRLDYGYKVEFVDVNVRPGSIMQLKTLTYDFNSVVELPQQKRTSVTHYTNNGDHNIPIGIKPYASHKASAVLNPEQSWAKYIEIEASVPMREDGGWAIGPKRQMRLSSKIYFTPEGVDANRTFNFDIPAQSTRDIVTTIIYITSRIPIEAVFVNPQSGREQKVKGTCEIDEPTDCNVEMKDV